MVLIHILCITVFNCFCKLFETNHTMWEWNSYYAVTSEKCFIRISFYCSLFPLTQYITWITIISRWPPGAKRKISIHCFPWKIHWELPLSRWSCSSLVIFPTIDFCVSLNINFRHLAIQNKMLYIMTETWKWYHNNVCL